MTKNTRKMIVTYALTYANGSMHLGHLVGLIQTDIWARFQKMQGVTCFYICGSDAHGTPIMIQAEKMHTTPSELVEKFRREHEKDAHDFYIEMDNYYTTDSPENKELSDLIYERHVKNQNIEKHNIKQAYDAEKNMFLPDRYIKGECPRCGAKDQYGDSCEVCGSTYSPIELKNPYSTLSGSKPIEKDSIHYFFKLQNFENMLNTWTRAGHLQEQVANKLDEWFEMGLKEWDISRDAPYFGFTIPGESSKYFYCWFDAPIGYMASFLNFCKRSNYLNFDEYWDANSTTELYHFIGKDIMYFHTLFWPAVLNGADFRTPSAVFCHGFLTIDGQKMSKSRGTFIKARTYLEYLNPEFLRYYLATKLSDRIEDLDIQFDDFMQRINSDLIGKLINIASRCASFINKNFSGRLAQTIADPTLLNEFVAHGDMIRTQYENREFKEAMRLIMTLADRANRFIDDKKPWSLKAQEEQPEVQAICTMGLNLFRLMMIYLKPVLPNMSQKVEAFFNVKPFQWQDHKTVLLDHTIQLFQPLAQRLDKKDIDAMKLAAKEDIVESTVIKAK